MNMTLDQRYTALSTILRAPTDQDYERVTQLMLEYRLEVNKPAGNDFSYKDANGVLEKVVQGAIVDVTPAIVMALLSHNAKVSIARHRSTNMWKALLGKDQVDIRSQLLQRAQRTCSDAIVLCLARHADQISIDEALPIAISINSTLKTYILLQLGGDVSKLCQAFQKAVEDGSDEMVDTLLSAGRRVCQDCRNTGLVRAAKLGLEVKAQTLLKYGADISFNQGSALKAAILNGSQKIAEKIALHSDMAQYPLLLDAAVAAAYNHDQFGLVEILLSAGARGPAMNETLAKALSHNRLDLAHSLVNHGASMPDEGESWFLSIIKSGRPELLQVALARKPSPSVLTPALLWTPKLANLNICHKMIALLLSAGVRGVSVSQALIQILDRALCPDEERIQMELINLLLEIGKADINLSGGRCVQLAVSQGRTDLLNLFLNCHPSTETLLAALSSSIDLSTPDLQRENIQIILNCRSENREMNGPNQEYLYEAAVAIAAKSMRFEVLQSLISPTISPTTVSTALAALVSENPRWLTSEGLTIIHMLLECGASGPILDDAFCEAVRVGEKEAINLLLGCVNYTVYDRALEDLVQYSKVWDSPEELWLVEELLNQCSDKSVNTFLIEAVRASTDISTLQDVVDAIFSLRSPAANVNYQNGEPVKGAIKRGMVPLVRTLLEFGATAETMRQAFIASLTYPLGEDIVLNLLQVLAGYKKKSGIDFDMNAVFPDGYPPLAACMLTHPHSAKLVERLIKLGCKTETKFHWKIYSTQGAGTELHTVLTWSASQLAGAEITADPIVKLIDANANVNFVAANSKVTPLILAAQNRRSDLVGKLIEAGADPNNRDRLGNTALFYASRSGDSEIAQQIVNSKPRPDDGSLHEAARNLRSKVVEILVKGKHDINFRSIRAEHEGRTPLQELAFNCDGLRDAAEIEETILALVTGKADIWSHYDGRNALFLSFENTRPYRVTSSMISVIWRDINNEKNVFQYQEPGTGRKFYYSPLMYFCYGMYSGDTAHVEGLTTLLRQMQCVDRYYAEPGPGDIEFSQPGDAVGMPKRLQEAETKRKDEEEKRRKKEREHQEKLARQYEEAQAKARIEQDSHQQEIYQSTMIHQSRMEREQQEAQLKSRIEQDSHQQKLHQTTMSHQGKMEREQQEAQIKNLVAYQTQQQKLQQTKASHQIKMAQNAQTTRQRQKAVQWEQDAAMRAQHSQLQMAQAKDRAEMQKKKQDLRLQQRQHKEDLEHRIARARLGASGGKSRAGPRPAS